MAIPRIAVGDVVQVIVRSHIFEQINLNVLHYKCLTAPGISTYFEMVDELCAAFLPGGTNGLVDAMRPLMGSNATIDWIQGQRVSPTRSLYLRTAVGTNGLVGSGCTASNVAAVLTKQVERVGRGRTGSFHLGGLAASMYSGGKLTGPATALAVTLADRLDVVVLTPGDGPTYDPVTFNGAAAVNLSTSPVINCFPQVELRTMRRRTVGLGI